MVYSKEMKEHAKELFFTPNIYGEHKYGWTEIANLIQEKFKLEKAPDPSTIMKWSQKKDDNGNSWESLWKQALINGVTRGEKDSPTTEIIPPDEQAYFRVEAFQRLVGTISQDLILKGYKFFEDENWKPGTIQEAKIAFDMGVKMYDVQHPNENPVNININGNDFNNSTQEQILEEYEGSDE